MDVSFSALRAGIPWEVKHFSTRRSRNQTLCGAQEHGSYTEARRRRRDTEATQNNRGKFRASSVLSPFRVSSVFSRSARGHSVSSGERTRRSPNRCITWNVMQKQHKTQTTQKTKPRIAEQSSLRGRQNTKHIQTAQTFLRLCFGDLCFVWVFGYCALESFPHRASRDASVL